MDAMRVSDGFGAKRAAKGMDRRSVKGGVPVKWLPCERQKMQRLHCGPSAGYKPLRIGERYELSLEMEAELVVVCVYDACLSDRRPLTRATKT